MIYKEIRDRGFDSHFFINGLADYMRDLMVARDPSTIVLLEADDEARKAMAATAAKCSPDFIYRAMNLCNEADLNYRTASNKQFLIELTLAKICQLLSPSHNNGAQGEGRLQKISSGASDRSQSPAANPASSQPAPSPQSGGVQPASMPQAMSATPSQPQAAPSMQPAPAARSMTQHQPAYQSPATPTPIVSAPSAGYKAAPVRQTAPLKKAVDASCRHILYKSFQGCLAVCLGAAGHRDDSAEAQRTLYPRSAQQGLAEFHAGSPDGTHSDQYHARFVSGSSGGPHL